MNDEASFVGFFLRSVKSKADDVNVKLFIHPNQSIYEYNERLTADDDRKFF